jgi:hypothetical protein
MPKQKEVHMHYSRTGTVRAPCGYTLVLILFLLLTTGHADVAAGPDRWAQVEAALAEGLPRSALATVETIYAEALQAEQWANVVRALTTRVALHAHIEGNRPEERIRLLHAERDKAPDTIRPLLDAVQAHWYWHFFQQNRWRFSQRTATDAPPGDDINTWDLPRIFAAIDAQFTQALAAAPALQAIPVDAFADYLQPGTVPDRFRPTLYDFVAGEALTFYTSGEQAGALPQDPFILAATDPVLSDLDTFLAWAPPADDAASPLYKAVRLYQDLLRFHAAPAQRDARLDWELQRLQFGYTMATGEERQERYLDALLAFAEQHANHELSALALYRAATVWQTAGDPARAHALATKGARRFPDTLSGEQCTALVREIEQPHSDVRAERVWNGPAPEMTIRYRNLDHVYFRLVPVDYVERISTGNRRGRYEYIAEDELDELLARTPARTWSVPLPATPDFQERTETLPVPTDLPPGFYVLLASHNEAFSAHQNRVTALPVWASDLALILRTQPDSSRIEGFVLDALSGDPVPGVRVRVWSGTWNTPMAEQSSVFTDALGRFRATPAQGHQHMLLAEHDGQSLALTGPVSDPFTTQATPVEERATLFTDRALYRPGQSIQFKGVLSRLNREHNVYEVIPHRQVTVEFVDVNGQLIEQARLRANAYGSVSGHFTAPVDRLAGAMQIRVRSPRGAASVQVEEYKRPTFVVSMQPPATAPRLNETVALTGTAQAYTGAPTDGAQVRWRVVREIRFPGWWPWWRRHHSPHAASSQEIVHGVTRTDAHGAFAIAFPARPDPQVPVTDQPTFRYTVYADVTDAAGETRSAQQTLQVGYVALDVELVLDDWLEAAQPVALTVQTRSLDGIGQETTGQLTLYSLAQPERVERLPIEPSPNHYTRRPQPPTHTLAQWETAAVLEQATFRTDATGRARQEWNLPAGAYRVVLEAQDAYGVPVRAEESFIVLDAHATRQSVPVPHRLDAPAWRVEPGETFMALWGSGYDRARAFIEIEHRGELVQAFWTDPAHTQKRIEQPVTEAMRGGFIVRTTMVRENRAYMEQKVVDVPWSNQELNIVWERFDSKLEPGQSAVWTAVISGSGAERAVAEMVATLYDASLDAFLPHRWPDVLGAFRTEQPRLYAAFQNRANAARHLRGHWPRPDTPTRSYRAFPPAVLQSLRGFDAFPVAASPLAMRGPYSGTANMEQAPALGDESARKNEETQTDSAPDLDQVHARANVQETAFFLPHLVSDEDGVIRISFTMPEAVTRWRFMGFAHDTRLRSGFLTDEMVTAKDLMVQPNPPRFLREGDELEFTVRVTNQSETRQTGTVRLQFRDAATDASLDQSLENTAPDQPFDVPAGESRTYAWPIRVPDGLGVVVYRAVAAAERLSDGEEAFVPVLPRRIHVRESLPLPVRGPATREFTFDKLLASDQSDTLEHEGLTVQMVGNPMWYAVLALPYLMEFPHSCSEQIFNRLYAHTLAEQIARSDPRIRAFFDQMRGTDALRSPLEQHAELRAILLEATPWVRQAQSESQSRRSLGMLFEQNRLADERARAMQSLTQQQYSGGAWPWFPGGPPNEYITLYIATGFGRLRHLGADLDMASARLAWQYLDGWIDARYRRIAAERRDDMQLSPLIALYLYGRTFFLEDAALIEAHQPAWNYYVEQAETHWLQLPHRQSQAHLALALHRLGRHETAQGIMRSLRERAVTDDELGMFWRDTEYAWWWYRAPIEAQAVMIEAFDEIMGDDEAVEACRVWLLKQKQTQDWKTTKATADAVYALLLRGTDRLTAVVPVEVYLAGEQVLAPQAEAFTGFYERRYDGTAVVPDMGRITVRKIDEGVAWGSVHWAYWEDLSQITAHTATPLTLEKTVYVRENTARGPVLTSVSGAVAVGDELVVRLVLRTDRDMEYVHLKDQRPSGAEPVNVLSRYRYQDGMAYYESTRDTASHFFIDYLPKGTYVFEYAVRVQHRGRYETGLATIECMYAPEFRSHSASIPLRAE